VPRSFAWIDHRLRSGGFLEKLTPEETALYLFLALAADREGLSCWRLDRIEREVPFDVAVLARRVEEVKSPLPSLGLRAPIVATIHAESDPITDFRHPWQYAAFTGLDPSGFQTGQITGTRAKISKRGSPYLRRAYYLAAMALYRRHADLTRCYARARKKRHTHRDALVIVAHKLARIAWRMLTDRRPFRKRPPRRAKGR
jgi:hypothetical protein